MKQIQHYDINIEPESYFRAESTLANERSKALWAIKEAFRTGTKLPHNFTTKVHFLSSGEYHIRLLLTDAENRFADRITECERDLVARINNEG